MWKRRILIVDDETKLTELIKSVLEQTGNYEVYEAHSGLKGLDAARTLKPDLILLDIMMPGMDGSEVAYKLHADEHLQQIPIVFLTAAVTKQEAGASQGVIGGHPFLAKPVTVEELIACVEKYSKVNETAT